MLLDTASLYFRAYFGVPESMTAPDGRPVNAVRGLADFIARLVGDHRPDIVVACWDDDWRPQWRVDLVPEYKAHRVAAGTDTSAEEIPDTLSPQVPLIAAMLAALGIPRVGLAGCEADDIIGTYATSALGRGWRVDVVTGDRDLFQLLDDAGAVRVIYTARSVANPQILDAQRLRELYGVAGSAYADFATLRGDASDGLPGVPGVGAKSAAALLAAFADLAGVRRAAQDPGSAMKPAQRRAIVAADDYLQRAAQVVRVLPDAPVPPLPDVQPGPDPAALARLATELGIGGPLERARRALSLMPADGIS